MAAHWSNIDHIPLDIHIVPEPGRHQMLQGVDGRRRHRWFPVGFCDPQVKGGEVSIFPGYIDAGIQLGVVDCKTLYNLPIL